MALAAAVISASAQPQDQPKPTQLPRPLFLAYGLDDATDVPKYAAAGFNCAYIEVSDRDLELSRQSLRSLVAACDKANLPVLVGFKPPADQFGRPQRASPRHLTYIRDAQDLILDVVQLLSDNQTVAGWVTPRRVYAQVAHTEDEFRKFVADQYGQLSNVETAWDTVLPDWRLVTMARAAALDDLKFLGVGRSTLDIAQFEATTYRDLISLWARTLLQLDGKRPVFAGEEPLYRGLACLPPNVCGVFTGIYSGDTETDELAQNVHAVDLARHGNRYQVIFGIRAKGLDEAKLRRWTFGALTHGAAGIAVEDWHDFAEQPPLGEAMKKILDHARQSGLAYFRPAPTAAVIYEPFAEGLMLRDGTPAYGFLRNFCQGEPNQLIYALRLGHRYGQVDYLTPAELLPNPDRYGVIFGLQTLDLPEAAVELLTGYVSRGGVLVGDLGLGMYESGNAAFFSPALSNLLGILRLPQLHLLSRNFTVWSQMAPFLSIPVGAQSSGGPRGFAFDGPVAYAQLTMGARPWARLATTRIANNMLVHAGISINSVGQGYAVFCTGRLFASWGPDDPLWERFMADLLARRAAIERTTAPGLFDALVEVAAGEDGSLVALNRDRQPRQVSLTALGPPGCLRTDCWNTIGLAAPEPGRRAAVIALIPENSAKVLRPAPVRVEAPACLARLTHYDADAIELEIRGPDTRLTMQNDDLVAGDSAAVKANVVLADGPYKLKPDSEHRVTVLDAETRQERSRLTVKANERGEIAVEATFDDALLRIEPAAKPPA